MRFALIAFGLAVFFSGASAQAQQIPANCQFQVNPHSYACTRWTFDGNQMFPLLPIDFANINGTWRPITFVDPAFENDGPEFAMFVDEQRPTVPMGVLDKATNRDLGDLVIDSAGASQMNWRGVRMDSTPGSMRITDRWSVQFVFSEPPYTHSFTCRDFNRNRNQHLLCSWDILMPQRVGWQHKGFFGYLR